MKPTTYTPQKLMAEQLRLQREIKRRERRLRQHWDDLVAPPQYKGLFRRWAYRAETAFSVADCFSTGFRLWQNVANRFGRKRKKSF